MKSGSSDPAGHADQKVMVARREIRQCSLCGTKFSATYDIECCPVCVLRGAAAGESASMEESSATSGSEQSYEKGEPSSLVRRFENYELMLEADGRPTELGRGAMGITYKAFDVDLRCPVALKIISDRYVGDESARLRFLREARAAASVRHPNVASVFRLGKSGGNYFYAMEFVEGETLEHFIKRYGRLEVILALDITAQVASALAAAHRAGLVHRDIKPANLIVSFEERNRPAVKVIDFGLVKVRKEFSDDSSASEPGVFLGTPGYASPEQFSDAKVDIRSDIYALGITLWQMLTKTTPFSGTPSQVAAQHLQAPLPVEKLRQLPQPVVMLLTHLLEKDPDNRPQTPQELLTLLRTTMMALGAPPGIVPPEPVPLAPAWRWKPRLRRRMYLGGAGLLAGGVLAILLLPSVTHRPPAETQKSVAVLPFDNIGNAPDQEYFSDGMTSEVIFELSKISDLRVISRDSVLRYKTSPNGGRKSVREIGSELEVAAILESSIRRIENHVRIVAILYDARSEKRLWATSYDRDVKDVFAIQSDLAQNIATALQVRLSSDERASIQQKPTESLAAYDLYLRGMAFYELRHKEDNERAIALFRQALEADPTFAPGYAGLAEAYLERVSRYEGERFWIDAALDLCRKAIALDPKQVRGHTALARALDWKELPDQAQEAIHKALELAPNDVEANQRAAYQLIGTDRFDEQYVLARKCHSLSPNDPSAPYILGRICAVVDEKDLAEKWMQRAIDLEDDPERRRMMECERMIFHQDFVGALTGLRQLPLNLETYEHSVLEFFAGCSTRVSDWATVSRLASGQLEKGAGYWGWDEGWRTWASYYLALASRAGGHDAEARNNAERVAASARKALAREGTIFWPRYFLAVASRFLDHREEAYQHLRSVFPFVLRALPLMRDDPSLEPFALDAEFQDMMSDFDKKNEVKRARIHEIEKNL